MIRAIRADPVAKLLFGGARESGKLETFEPTRLPNSSSEEGGNQESSIPRNAQSTLIDPLVFPKEKPDWRRQLRLLPPRRNLHGND
jgi:hypothetical protein